MRDDRTVLVNAVENAARTYRAIHPHPTLIGSDPDGSVIDPLAAKIEQLVVLIDDLDRCLPSTAIETLEAIRLFLFVPKTAFVIGADEAMIEYAVRQHFPDLPVASGPMPYARNYLEKLVQVPFRIPALGSQETRSYVLLLMVESIVGDDHAGFLELLAKAKEGLNKPWLGA